MKMTQQEFLHSSGLPQETLELCLTQRWIIPEQTPTGTMFSDMDLARALLIEELATNIGANNAGIDIILHLVDQLHGVRYALTQLHMRMKG